LRTWCWISAGFVKFACEKIEAKYLDWQLIPVGKWDVLKHGKDIVIVAIGPILDDLIKLSDEVEIQNNISVGVVNARYIKPLDLEVMNAFAEAKVPILVYEEASLISGLGSAMLEYYSETGQTVNMTRMGVPDIPIVHGDIPSVLSSLNLSLSDVKNEILEIVGARINE